jgi:hypothetical protein
MNEATSKAAPEQNVSRHSDTNYDGGDLSFGLHFTHNCQHGRGRACRQNYGYQHGGSEVAGVVTDQPRKKGRSTHSVNEDSPNNHREKDHCAGDPAYRSQQWGDFWKVYFRTGGHCNKTKCCLSYVGKLKHLRLIHGA